MIRILLLGFLPGAVLGFCNTLGLATGFEALMRDPYDLVGVIVTREMTSMLLLASVPTAFLIGLFTTLLVKIRYMRPSELVGAAAGALASIFVPTPYGAWGIMNVVIMLLWTPIGTVVGWIAGKIVGAFLPRKTVDGRSFYWKDFE